MIDNLYRWVFGKPKYKGPKELKTLFNSAWKDACRRLKAKGYPYRNTVNEVELRTVEGYRRSKSTGWVYKTPDGDRCGQTDKAGNRRYWIEIGVRPGTTYSEAHYEVLVHECGHVILESSYPSIPPGHDPRFADTFVAWR
jgi:hypothetical protein